MQQKFSNNATAGLTSNMTEASLSCTIDPTFADLFPVAVFDASYFKVTVQKITGEFEIMKVRLRTAGSAALQQIQRGQDGTTPLAFTSGQAVVSVNLVANDIELMVNHMNSTEGAHSAGAISFSPTDDIDANNAQDAIEAVQVNVNNLSADVDARASIAAIQKGTFTGYISTGTPPNYVITPNPALDELPALARFQVKIHADATADSTLHIAESFSHPIKQFDLSGGKVSFWPKAGMLLELIYDGTDFVAISGAPAISNNAPGDVVWSMSPTKAPNTRRILIGTVSSVSLTDYPTLAFLWCGATYNNHGDPSQRADFLYRCVDPANPDTTRNNGGNYLVIPPAGYFMRILNPGWGVDAGRNPYKLQDDDNKAHTHTFRVDNLDGPDTSHPNGAGNRATGTSDPTSSSGGAEARPKNWPGYAWLCY